LVLFIVSAKIVIKLCYRISSFSDRKKTKKVGVNGVFYKLQQAFSEFLAGFLLVPPEMAEKAAICGFLKGGWPSRWFFN
jgi:hypothetical protein